MNEPTRAPAVVAGLPAFSTITDPDVRLALGNIVQTDYEWQYVGMLVSAANVAQDRGAFDRIMGRFARDDRHPKTFAYRQFIARANQLVEWSAFRDRREPLEWKDALRILSRGSRWVFHQIRPAPSTPEELST